MNYTATSPQYSRTPSTCSWKSTSETKHVVTDKQTTRNQTTKSDTTETQRLSFEQELTFSPMLNGRSKKLARSKETVENKMKLGSQHRVELLLEEMDKNFTFKPKLSCGSNRIARNLKNDFWTRQAIHFNKKKVEKHNQIEFTTTKQIQKLNQNSPDAIHSKNSMKQLSSCPNLRHHKTNETSTEKYLRKTKKQLIQQESRFPRSHINKKESAKSEEHSNLLRENISLTMALHRKRALIKQPIITPKPQDINPDRLYRTKIEAEKVLRAKKVFLCHGPYALLRYYMRQRGWIEKHFKATSTTLMEENTVKQNDTIYSTDAVKPSTCLEIAEKPEIADGDSTTAFIHQSFQDNDQYSIMSRMARNSLPTFIWTCKRDNIDFKFLKKDQIVNHYLQAASFTTKAGLCVNLRKLPWFEPARHQEFFPRCHRLSSEEEQIEFIDDYRITSAICILKWVVSNYNNEQDTLESIKTESLSSPTSSKTEPKHLISSDAVKLALNACDCYLSKVNHEDIEPTKNYEFSDGSWAKLIEFHYQFSSGNVRLEKGDEYFDACLETLDKMKPYLPQLEIDGSKNIWIVKPGAKSRGRGIIILSRLDEILAMVSNNVFSKENRLIVQKYVELPLLIFNTKFDIRQWFLVTDWNPLTIWFYKDCYLRFCGQEFTLDDFELQVHLANNSIQKGFQNGTRSHRLPDENMWSSTEFKEYLKSQHQEVTWDSLIYPGMKQSILYALESCQDTLEYRKNSFELYGADFLLDTNYKPWLIEINCSPAIGPSTMVTKKLCSQMINDMLKVVIDRRENRSAETGQFELAYKQPQVSTPSYIGSCLAVEGVGIPKPTLPIQRSVTVSPSKLIPRSPTKTQLKETILKHEENKIESQEETPQTIKETVIPENSESNEKSQLSGKRSNLLAHHSVIDIPLMCDNNSKLTIGYERLLERSNTQPSIGFRTKFYRCRQLPIRKSPPTSTSPDRENLAVDTRGLSKESHVPC